jgi:hypothetical protein
MMYVPTDLRSKDSDKADKKPDVREAILVQANDIVTTNRNKQYGEPEENFGRIADLWNAYIKGIDRPLNAGDVALLMVLMKVARLEENHNNWDSWLDLIGYGACGAHTVFDEPPK